MNTDPLMLLVGLPVASGLVCLALGRKLVALAKGISLAVTVTATAGSLYVFINKPLSFEAFSETLFKADGLSALIALAASAFSLIILIYSFGYMNKPPSRYFGYFLITLGASLGVALSCNVILLMVFWGIVASMLFLLVSIEGGSGAASAAKKALIISGGTDAVMMFGLCAMSVMTGAISMDKMHIQLSGPLSYAAFFSLAIAAFAKAGVVPLHSWIPDVAEKAPVPVTALLPASLDKLLGIYLLTKASLHLFKINGISSFALLSIGSATVIIAVMMALVQHDLKRLLGYHAVSQVGYMVIGIGTGNPIGMAGGLFHMLNNVMYKSCLFMISGAVEKKAGTSDLDKLGGLAKAMPITFLSCLVASLSISGIPPFNGFVSKWMIYQGIIGTAGPKDPFWMVWLSAAMFGSALTVASFMKVLHAVFMGRAPVNRPQIKEAPLSMWLPSAILAAGCIIFGVFAFQIPVSILIAPSIGIPFGYLGTWSPIGATMLVLAGIVMGVIAYFILRPGVFRKADAFVGGEDAESMERLSGTDFYNTIKDVKAVAGLYKSEEKGDLDLYSLVKRPIGMLTGFLQYVHNGVLPSYMVWCLLGLMGMFIVFMTR